jgi:phosphoribosylaminoimidazolecarboxamide formyltransferase / IMP cyclohydrolase
MSTERRALLSLSNKSGLIPFAEGLLELSFDLVSTGGTARALREAGLPVTEVSEITGFPEMMDGRVKTLHPKVHAALLARSGIDDHVLSEHGIRAIDLVAVNLYPFEEVIARPTSREQDAIESIDVGGPAMIRAAAKNHERLTVVVDSADYPLVLDAFREGGPSAALMRRLAAKAFAHTARYDAAISGYLSAHVESREPFPAQLVLAWRLGEALRYGENPHQQAALYLNPSAAAGSIARATLVQGKPLSFNNVVDADAALECANAFAEAACVIVKHANPCGAAIGDTPLSAYQLAYRTDPTSAFGGVIAFNRRLDQATADAIIEQQVVDVIVAPRVDDGAREVLARKRNTRVLETGSTSNAGEEWELKSIGGGLLMQQRDTANLERSGVELRTVTRRQPTEAELRDLRFAWSVVKFVKSNAIVYASGGRTLGIGAGQMSRVMSARIAAQKAAEEDLDLAGAVMASDAFFPFRDGLDAAAAHGIRAVIQPGGSLRDEDVIRAADEHDMAMVFTGIRHFRH